jgi:hypothetical protein
MLFLLAVPKDENEICSATPPAVTYSAIIRNNAGALLLNNDFVTIAIIRFIDVIMYLHIHYV